MSETNSNQSEHFRDMDLLSQIEQDPDISQASLAQELGVAVGTINWHLKRLIEKGYVKVKRAQRKKLRYIITPEGLALRARLTIDFVKNSFVLYRRIREMVIGILGELKMRGYSQVTIEGEGEIADVCRLTCMEQGVTVSFSLEAPSIIIDGLKVHLIFPEEKALINSQQSIEQVL
ncbi:MAG: winged helix-turn-helix transcriptional regulator [Anaerolineaceae bacterium]|nr:winged helix-turn-helix transcriptional regulator [Anaerolineaceae bacterium]